MAVIGIVTNGESGRDVRRLVTGASVSDNAEKAAIMARLAAGAAAAGVERVLVMPTSASVVAPLERHLRQVRSASHAGVPEVEILDFTPAFDPSDTERATSEMVARGCGAIAVLGGDGTHRVVASRCADVPLLAVSTGTNNAFPVFHEATTAGVALGLIATGQVEATAGCRRERAFQVEGPNWSELALVDVAVVRQRFAGSKAVWRGDDIEELFIVFGDPTVVGLSALASACGSFERGGDVGVRISLAQPGEGRPVVVALAPGMFTELRVRHVEPIRLGDKASIESGTTSIALDGERTIERPSASAIGVQLIDGPWTIDPRRTLVAASGVAGLRRRDASVGAGCA